jgi:hypothetical protein
MVARPKVAVDAIGDSHQAADADSRVFGEQTSDLRIMNFCVILLTTF